MIRTDRRSATRILLCLFWAVGILVGSYKATVYSTTSAEVLPQLGRWPGGTSLTLADDRPTMLLTLHPRCVCSRATLDELTRLLAQIPVPPRVEILLYQPAAESPSWAQTDLAVQARSIPGVGVQPDPDGLEANRFGIPVSGHTAVYSQGGKLLFSGGITRARGHAGDNAGRAAIVALLLDQQPTTSRTPVFDCSILDRSKD